MAMQEQFYLFEYLPSLCRIGLYLLFLEHLVDVVVFPVGIVPCGSLEINAAEDTVVIYLYHAFTLAGHLPITFLIGSARRPEEGITRCAWVGSDIASDA